MLILIDYINSPLSGSAEGEAAGLVDMETPAVSRTALGADEGVASTGDGTPLTARASVASAAFPYSP